MLEGRAILGGYFVWSNSHRLGVGRLELWDPNGVVWGMVEGPFNGSRFRLYARRYRSYLRNNMGMQPIGWQRHLDAALVKVEHAVTEQFRQTVEATLRAPE